MRISCFQGRFILSPACELCIGREQEAEGYSSFESAAWESRSKVQFVIGAEAGKALGSTFSVTNHIARLLTL